VAVGPKTEIPPVTHGGHKHAAVGNQRDLNDVDWRENYLLVVVTQPATKLKIPGAEQSTPGILFPG
jgi:hypothetical protein